MSEPEPRPPEHGLDHPNVRANGGRAPLVVLALVCLAAFAYMEIIALSEWKTANWHLSDVGTIQSVLVNTWGGNFMYSAGDMGNFFAFHFSPFLFLLMPFVWLSKYPIPLVTGYQLALALTPIPLYAIARERGLAPVVGICLGIWFLGNHFVGSLEMSNHFEAYYLLFALGVMALMRRSNSWGFWVCAVLALSVKEDCSLWLLAYAVWEWIFHRANPVVRKRAVRLGILCVVWGGIAVGVIALASMGQETSAEKYMTRMDGMSVGLDTLLIYGLLIASSGGLSLINWKTALLLLAPLPVVLGNFSITRHLLYYYSYPFLPFLALATVDGTAKLVNLFKNRDPAKTIRLQHGIAAFIAVVGLIQLPLMTRTNDAYRYPHTANARDEMRLKVADTILPEKAPLALQYGLWGVVPWRFDTVFLNDHELRDRHFVFMDMRAPYGYGPDEFERLVDRLKQDIESGRRKTLYDSYDFLILSPATDGSTTTRRTFP